MSFYNTGNPVPSIDPRDLDDNAKHIDELTNSTFPTFVDRLGTTRRTLAGIEADADAATLRGDLASDTGASLVHNSPAAGFSYDLATWSSRIVYAEDWDGVDPTGVSDSSAGVNAAVAYLVTFGGGEIRYGPGKFKCQAASFRLASKVRHSGSGFSVTYWFSGAGSNVDVFKTDNFDALTGVGPINAAPVAYGVVGGTLHGNYLDLGPTWTEISWRDSDAVLNTAGCGIKSFGTRCEFDIEVFNVADNAVYTEAIGAQFDNNVSGIRLKLDGRISGQEGVVMRGPGDSNIESIGFGLCGILKLSDRAATASLASRLYPSDQVNGMVIDNSGIYEGHCEIDFAHIYAVSFGYGFRTLGVCRLNARHLCVDNSRGGYALSDGTHGFVSIGEARASGRQPANYVGAPIAPLPDLLLANGTIWAMEFHLKTARYSPSGEDSNYAVQITGSNNLVFITRQGQLQGDGKPILSPFLSVTGDANNVSFTCKRQRGNVVYLAGNSNNIRGTCSQVWAGTVLIRDTTAGSNCFGNSVDITAEALQIDAGLFNAIGTAASENIRLLGSGNAGYSKFAGSPMSAVNRAVVWAVMALDGSGINGKSTEDYIDVVVPTGATSGSLTVPHNFLYTPAQIQVQVSRRTAGTPPNQLLDLTVGATSATDVVIHYLWAALPSSGSANAVIHIR